MNRKGSTRTEATPKGKPVSASASEMAEVVLPAQTNALGKLLGGHVMHLVDIVAAMAASRHANSYMVTASVDYIDFQNPVNLGEIVILKSHVNRVFHTSLEIGVEVYSEDILTGERKQTTTAYVTFVAIDEHTRLPKQVPAIDCENGGREKTLERSGKAERNPVSAPAQKNAARVQLAKLTRISLATFRACSMHVPMAGPFRKFPTI